MIDSIIERLPLTVDAEHLISTALLPMRTRMGLYLKFPGFSFFAQKLADYLEFGLSCLLSCLVTRD